MRRVLLLAVALTGCPRAIVQSPHADPPKHAADTPAVLAPGPCLEPVSEARRRLGSDADAAGVKLDRSVDLDGDGAFDVAVTHQSFCGTGGCVWHLFLARGTCGHWVGEMFGVTPVPRTASSHGLVELEIATRDGCGGLARTEARARFDGRAYSTYSQRRCRCPTESTGPDDVCSEWSEGADAGPPRAPTAP